MKTLSIMGAGKVGKTLGLLLCRNKFYQIQDIVCRNQQHAIDAAAFIGQGRPITDYRQLKPVDTLLISVNDDELFHAVSILQSVQTFSVNDIIFHCSGSFSHEILIPLKNQTNQLASLHPIKSFSQPVTDYKNFSGTYCTLEGEEKACKVIENNFHSLGCHVLNVSTKQKMLVHIAAIFSSNYLITLLETSLQLLEKAGIDQKLSISLLEPLVLGAFQQAKHSGTPCALTGPVARGEAKLIENHIELLRKETQNFAPLYQILGTHTLRLAEQMQLTDENVIEKIRDSLLSQRGRE